MKRFISVIVLAVILSFSAVSYAGAINVKWQEPDNYRDIRHANTGKQQFRDNVFYHFEKHFTKLAEQLPTDVELNLKVVDLNLAGDVSYNFSLHREIRIVKRFYWPSIKLEYQLKNADGIIKEGEVTLKDMAFMDRGGSFRLSHDSYYYEKRILTDWFDKHVQTMLARWQEQQSAVMNS